jgi:hypothetical protein
MHEGDQGRCADGAVRLAGAEPHSDRRLLDALLAEALTPMDAPGVEAEE